MIRESPTELLRHLEAHRLGAFGVVAAEVDVREAPPVSIGNLRAQPVDVVVIALDRNHLRTIDRGAEDFVRLEVVWNEDVARKTETRRVSGDTVREIPGRGAAKHREAE